MLPARPPEGLSVGFDQRRSGLGLYRNDHHFQENFEPPTPRHGHRCIAAN